MPSQPVWLYQGEHIEGIGQGGRGWRKEELQKREFKVIVCGFVCNLGEFLSNLMQFLRHETWEH